VFDYVYYKVNDYHAAEEITSQTLALYCLKCSYEDEDRIRGWLINTAKNYLKKHFETNSKENKTFVQYSDQLHHFFPDELNEEDQKSLKDAFHEAFQTLSKVEFELIMLYLRSQKSIRKMHEIMGGSYNALKKRISRIRKKLKAETYRNLGFYGSKRIVTPELDNQIYQFLRRFKKNLKVGTLEKMYYYFSEIDLKKYTPPVDIKKIVDYDIEINNSIYKVWVFYKNRDLDGDSFFIEFYIDNNNHLKIITPPMRPQKVVVIQANSTEGNKLKELLSKFPIDKTGHPNVPKEEIEKIIKQLEAKQKESK
jgi:RNA polymerase sigma factor (sigma-70 family)